MQQLGLQNVKVADTPVVRRTQKDELQIDSETALPKAEGSQFGDYASSVHVDEQCGHLRGSEITFESSAGSKTISHARAQATWQTLAGATVYGKDALEASHALENRFVPVGDANLAGCFEQGRAQTTMR